MGIYETFDNRYFSMASRRGIIHYFVVWLKELAEVRYWRKLMFGTSTFDIAEAKGFAIRPYGWLLATYWCILNSELIT